MLTHNQLTFVPPALAVMTNLERISLRANYITELPTEWHALAGGEAVVRMLTDADVCWRMLTDAGVC
jgi:hypothetical protein